MPQHRRDLAPPSPAPHSLGPEAYLRLLHPPGSAGCVTLMARDGAAHARALRAEHAAAAAPL